LIDVSKIKFIIDRAPILSIPENIMKLIRWIKDYYISDYYNVIRTVYPGTLKLNYSKKAIYVKNLEDKESETENMYLFEKSNEKLSEILNCPIIEISALRNKNIDKVWDMLDFDEKLEKELLVVFMMLWEISW